MPRAKPSADREPGSTRELPLVALRETVIFPEMIVPLQVGRDKSVAALNAAVAGTSLIALVTQRRAEQEEIDDASGWTGSRRPSRTCWLVSRSCPTSRLRGSRSRPS